VRVVLKRFAGCDYDLDDYAEEGRFLYKNNIFIYLYSGWGPLRKDGNGSGSDRVESPCTRNRNPNPNRKPIRVELHHQNQTRGYVNRKNCICRSPKLHNHHSRALVLAFTFTCITVNTSPTPDHLEEEDNGPRPSSEEVNGPRRSKRNRRPNRMVIGVTRSSVPACTGTGEAL
jgi:hypothetical protein